MHLRSHPGAPTSGSQLGEAILHDQRQRLPLALPCNVHQQGGPLPGTRSAQRGHRMALQGVVAEPNSDGWYTPDQATHGHIVFNSYCAECHRPDLTGAMGPALIGDAFLKTWLNRPLGDLYEFEHSKMPANNPGSVPDDKLWTITAFLLQKNGFPAGASPLSAQAASRTLAKAQ